jgi:hypothetical protein
LRISETGEVIGRWLPPPDPAGASNAVFSYVATVVRTDSGAPSYRIPLRILDETHVSVDAGRLFNNRKYQLKVQAVLENSFSRPALSNEYTHAIVDLWTFPAGDPLKVRATVTARLSGGAVAAAEPGELDLPMSLPAPRNLRYPPVMARPPCVLGRSSFRHILRSSLPPHAG